MRSSILSVKSVRILSIGCWVFFTAFQIAHAEGPVRIKKNFEDILIPASSIQGIEDPNGKLSFADISTLDFQKKISTLPYGTKLKADTYYWLKFSLINESDKETNWILQLPLHSENL